MTDNNTYLGSGLLFPFVIDNQGVLALESGDTYLIGSLQNLLSTPKGTIIGQRDYGHRIEKALYYPVGAAKGIITEAVRECIENWGNGVRFSRLEIIENTDAKIDMLIHILVDGSKPLSFVFPYYKNV